MKSKLQLIINGKPVTIPIELTENQLKEITAAANLEDALNGWEEPEIGQMGYFEDEFNEVKSFEVQEHTLDFARALYKNENYFTDDEVAHTVVHADNVMRKLRHFALEHRSKEIDYSKDGGYTITYNYIDKCLECGVTGNWLALGDVVFDTEEAAREAMNLYSADLIWYFTYAKKRF